MTFSLIGVVRAKSQVVKSEFIDGQITELVHGQGVRVSLGVVLLNFLQKNKEKSFRGEK